MRYFTKYFSFVMLAGLSILALSGCESLGLKSSETQKNRKIEVVNNVEPKTAPIQNNQRLSNSELKNMSSVFSGGSVEVYDLDGDGVVSSPTSFVQSDYIGIPMATDPRVIVYPLDGDVGSFPVPLGNPNWNSSGFTPPVKGRLSPSVPDVMTYAPSSIWSDDVLENNNGVLSPRVGQNISSVYFRYGSAKLDNANRRALSDISEIAKFAPVDRVSVEGHASKTTQTPDPIKSKILNLKESMNRVQAVSQKLMEDGVPAEKIKTTAWGDTKPSGVGEAQDRRVDIITGFSGQ